MQIPVIFLFLLALQIWKMTVTEVEGRPEPRCSPCPPNGCPVPENCEHGIIVDNCGRSSCAMGPGQRCKIKRFRIQGNCGQGMYCNCGVCMGCSLFTYDCYETTCVIARLSR